MHDDDHDCQNFCVPFLIATKGLALEAGLTAQGSHILNLLADNGQGRQQLALELAQACTLIKLSLVA